MRAFASVYIFSIILMTAVMGWILTKGNRSRQTFSCILCQLLLNIWSASQLFQLEAVNTRQLFISYCIGNIGICFIGTLWFIFSCYTSDKKIPKAVKLLMLGFSVSMLIMAFTNPLHKLFYSTFTFEKVIHGPVFYLNILYTYVCMFSGTAMLCRKLYSVRHKRGQLIMLVLSAVIPLCTNILYLFGAINTLYDITPLAFSVSSILVLFATNRYGFLNVNEIAFDKAMENISEGVCVFGKNGFMSYSNATMRELFPIDNDCLYDSLLSSLSPAQRQSVAETGEAEIDCSDKTIRLKEYRQFKKNGQPVAIILIASDITRYYEMARQEQALSEAKRKLAIESERNRIAQEVHDTAGHTLTMINSLAKLIGVSADKKEFATIEQYARETQQLSSQGIAQLRVSINNLRGRSENSLITDGLRQLADSVRGLDAELCIQGTDSEKYSFCANVIYENTREAITNCLKYSSAERMDIIVKLLENSAEVYIIDNGKGCSEINFGNGLKGMRERTEKIGGSIRFTSSDQCGFSITMKFPIKGE